EQWQPQLHR
uniref:Peptide Ppnp7 n=1 Tax=Polybia paulista TaxID=291283 RepID=PPNP7_POLPI|nr:RecName: Full=Peptide Ppnp7; AltName: Full=Neuropolybin [Polybia paulista]